jgi:hypothetical protein
MNPDLTILVPTRGRPKVIRDFFGEFERTKTLDSAIFFIFDEDDPDLASYRANIREGMRYVVAPPTSRGMVGALNWAFHEIDNIGSLGYSVGFMGDDHRPRTIGWDDRYVRSLRALKTGFVYGNDLLQGGRMPTQVAMSIDIPRTLGWMCPPQFEHLCVDVIWKDLGDGIDRITYLDDVIIEHLHPIAGKARNDRNYRQVNNILLAKRDADRYAHYIEDNLPHDIDKLRRLIT